MARALFALRNDGTDAYFRGIAPASVLRYNGYEVEAHVPAAEDVEEFDIAVFCRHCEPVAELIAREFKDAGKPLIYDVDDLLFEIPPSWDAYGQYYHRGTTREAGALVFHRRMLALADLVTCTGRALQQELRKHAERVAVLPNCVMWADWDPVVPMKRVDDRPLVGWFGLPYQWDSWREIAPYLTEVLDAHDAYLTIIGYPEVIRGFPPELRERTVVHPMVLWKDFADVRRMVAAFDVGISWVTDTTFMRCKSPLKVLQYGAAGVPVVASSQLYGPTLRGTDTDDTVEVTEFGIVAHTPEGLAHGISLALDARKPAKERAAAFRQHVFTHHSYEMCWRQWLEVLEVELARANPDIGALECAHGE